MTRDRAMASDGLDERVLRIQQDKDDINALIQEYEPFIRSTAYKCTGKTSATIGDEISIAMMAFAEAVDKYDQKKGRFLTFAQWVIRRRIIDHQRSQRDGNTVPLTAVTADGEDDTQTYAVTHDQEGLHNPIRLEILALTQRLQAYPIAFGELVLVSPKAGKTRAACQRAVQYVTGDPVLIEYMQRTHRLPIKKIIENCMIPRKLLDRHRKYIITVIEILQGDYPYLSEYVALYKQGASV